jgi:predicted  nucleic acid-binding Zn-ribbon protein
MKKSEFKAYIREEIISVLSEEMSPAEAQAKKANLAAAQEKIKDAQAQLQTATTPLEKNAATAALKAAQEDLKQANAIKESDDEDPSDSEIKKDKSASKLAKDKEEIKKIEAELKDGLTKTKEILKKDSKDRTEADKKHIEKMADLTKKLKQLKASF